MDEKIYRDIIDAGAVEGDILGIWYNATHDRYFVNLGDWAVPETVEAVKRVLGEETWIEAEAQPGSGYEGVWLGKAEIGTGWSTYFDIAKVDSEQRIVVGYATVETPDGQGGEWNGQYYAGDVVDTVAVKQALPDYMSWANLREMHQNSAVGTVLEAEIVQGEVEVDGRTLLNPVRIVAKVVDDAAWQKVKEGVYKGFSIGGKVVKAALEKVAGKLIRRITELRLTEISLVDRPAHPDAKILLWKLHTDEGGTMSKPTKTAPAAQLPAPVAKAADADKAMQQLQALRNDAEMGGDLQGAELYTQAIALILQAKGQAEPGEESVEMAEGETEEEESQEEVLEQAEGEAEEEQDRVAMAAKSKLRKVRKMVGPDSSMMHGVIKTLAGMLADSGDEIAAKIQACYGSPEGDSQEKVAKVAGEMVTELSKVLQPALDNLNQKLDGIDGRLAKVEAQPMPGGPVLRPADKTIAGQPPAPAPEASRSGKSVDELRKLAATEPNPMMRAEYTRQLIVAEQATARR